MPTSRRSPSRTRSGLRLVQPCADAAPRRACDDPKLILPSIIYAIPIWEISSKTGLIRLYEYDPAARRHATGRDGRLILVTEVPHVDMATRTARPRIVWDYIGQTVRPLEVREAEHEEQKCWADIKADRAIVLVQGHWDKKTRDGAEIAKIAELKPRFNKEHNEHNRYRIEIWRQVQLRHARDRALQRPLWLPLEQRTAAAVREAELNVVGAGLDGREPRYPLTVLGEALARFGRWLWSHRAVRLFATAAGLWGFGTTTGAYLLSRQDWPPRHALTVSLIVFTVLTAAVFGRRRRRR